MDFAGKYILPVVNNTFYGVFLFFLTFFFPSHPVQSEGSGTWGHGINGQAMLWHAAYSSTSVSGYGTRGFFLLPTNDGLTGTTYEANYNPEHRLFVYVKAGETVYWGFRAGTTAVGQWRVRWFFDADDTSFYPNAKTAAEGMTVVSFSNGMYSYDVGGNTYKQFYAQGVTENYQGRPFSALQAQIGPAQLGNTGGYTAHYFTNTTGVDRAFWVEFTNTSDDYINIGGFHIDFWDITVANASGIVQNGRVYSKFWSISNSRTAPDVTSLTITAPGVADAFAFGPDFGFYIPVDNTFTLDMNDDYFIKRIRVPGGSGGWTNFFANQDGPINTGDYQQNRRSMAGTSSNIQYPLFLNDPDPTIWKTTTPPTASLSIDYREKTAPETGGEAVVDLSISMPGVVDILVDLNDNEVFDEGIDIILSYNFEDPGTFQIIWDGVDASGNELPLGADINFIASVIFFPVHFPIYDFEQSLGIRITNIRPGEVEDNLIYWDDSQLSTAELTTGQTASDPRVNVTGVLGPDHSWHATGDNGFANNRTLNTWAASYYTEVKERGNFFFLTITGNVFTDLNALEDNQVGGTPPTLSPLYATLVNTSNNTVSRVARVGSNGFYGLRKIGNGNYIITLTTDSLAVGTANPEPKLPSDWENTGENLGTGNGHDGIVNGTLSGVNLNGTSIFDANFGIRPIITDLWVTKVVNNEEPEYGTEVIFTIVASNNGYSVAQNVQVLESMPSGYLYLRHTVTGGTYDPDAKIWDIGTLEVGTTLTLTLTARVEEAHGDYINHVMITGTTPDSNLSNNTDDAETTPFRILPVTWLDFSANANEEQIILKWTTAREKGNKYFVLQRSRDEKSWINVNQISGSGTTEQITQYQSIDGRPFLGSNFYRLAQVNDQGEVSHSKVIGVNFDPELGLSVYPNPFVNQVTVEAKNMEELKLDLIDGEGMNLSLSILERSENHLKLDLQKLPEGMYFIRLSNARKVWTKKLIKR